MYQNKITKTKDIKSVQHNNKSEIHTVQKEHLPANQFLKPGQKNIFQCKESNTYSDEKILIKNNTGLPDNLKAGIESLSGVNMDDVKVHYNSSKPSQLQALAYTKGTDIHVAPGQERHLPHEAWHVVQQKQGRVKPTMQMKGVNINDDSLLEHEADVMGKRAIRASFRVNTIQLKTINNFCVQARLGEGEFSFMKTDDKGKKSAISRPVINLLRDNAYNDIFSLEKYNINYMKKIVGKTSLQRDHIIPYNTIMKFSDKILKKEDLKPERNNWFISGVNKMAALGGKSVYYNVGEESRPLNEYTNGNFTKSEIIESIKNNSFNNENGDDKNKFEVIHKAISWMPGNIMIAPSPKLGDTHNGDDFDDTCKNIIPNDKYNFLFETYNSMKSFINDTTKTEDAKKALTNLNEIIIWDGPYAFNPEQWLLDKSTMMWKNNLKSGQDVFNDIQNSITKAEQIVMTIKKDMKTIDHLTYKEYKKLKSRTQTSTQQIKHCIEILESYYNSPVSRYTENSIKKWKKICQYFDNNLNRVEVKYQKYK